MLSRFSFQAAKVNQKIKEERMNIDIVDRMKQIEIQENEIERRRKELGRQQKCQKSSHGATFKREVKHKKF